MVELVCLLKLEGSWSRQKSSVTVTPCKLSLQTRAFDFQDSFPTAGTHNFPIWRCAKVWFIRSYHKTTETSLYTFMGFVDSFGVALPSNFLLVQGGFVQMVTFTHSIKCCAGNPACLVGVPVLGQSVSGSGNSGGWSNSDSDAVSVSLFSMLVKIKYSSWMSPSVNSRG